MTRTASLFKTAMVSAVMLACSRIQYNADLDMHPGARISGQINGPKTTL